MKKVLGCCLVFAMLTGLVLSVGCGGSSGGLAAILGAITIAAIVTASGGGAGALVFAADIKSPVALVRFAADSDKFAGKIKLNGVELPTAIALTRSDDGTQLLLNTTLSDISDGKQQISIDVYPTGSTLAPVLRSVVTATVSGGATTAIAPAVDCDTTAKAMAYDKWAGASTNSIDDFKPADADIASLALQIRTELLAGGVEINPAATFEYSAALIASVTQTAENTAVPAATVVYQKRLAGNYRAFTFSAGTQNRWASMCEIAVTGDQLVSIVKIDPSDPVGTQYTATVSETDGGFSLIGDTQNRGVVSPSGNFAILHDWQSDDPNTALFVKIPTAATNTTLNGTYRLYECSDDVNATYVPTKATTQVCTMTFNNGTFTRQSIFDPYSEWDNNTSGNYSVSTDGTVTIVGSVANSYAQVSADGNVFVHVSFLQGEYCDLSIGIKEGGSTWNGSFLNASVAGAVNNSAYSSYSVSSLITANGSSYTELDKKTESSVIPLNLLTENYTIINAGVINITAAPESNYGSIDPSGEVYCITTKYINNPFDGRFFAFGVKK